LREAEQVIGEALRANKTAIKEWAKLAGPGQTKAFTLDVGRIIGQGIVRGSSQMQPMSKVVVVLSKVVSQNRIYFVLTSYPSLSRRLLMSDYPQLETLVGGWFHQDFDINGDTLEEIIAAYRGVTPVHQQRSLATEIERFLKGADDVDAEFQRRFKPDVLPTGFAPTTRQFLTTIASLLDGA
jgi:hypothetical protein